MMTRHRSLAPLNRLSMAAGQCPAQAEKYGQCMLRHYQEMERDVCAAEFRAFLTCVRERLQRR